MYGSKQLTRDTRRRIMQVLVLVMAPGTLFLTPSLQAVAASGAVSACAATPFHFTAHQGARSVPNGIPWFVASPKSAHIIGFLFFLPPGTVSQNPQMHIHGNGPNGRSDKILWYVTKGQQSTRLAITGTNLSSPITTRSREINSGNGYPSILDVPTPGCWNLTIHNGKVKGHVTVEVLP